ncbi:MAG TPA: 3-deoxy-7-phosphoheptulonate synthase class II [Actinomycetota bacterium]|nr:3-deoxy-7-phosphoheptulonate synthase class II [Actinomycetota bacterium]
METWEPSSWRRYPAAQQPEWPDAGQLDDVLAELRRLPPLVFAGEARHLRTAIAKASQGEAFVLQAGDCAEAFGDFAADDIRDKLKIILQMAVVLTYAAGLPVVKIGRIAGQFAKPRSSPDELVGDVALPSFRGHAVNDSAFEAGARRPDPTRLIKAYHQSVATLNLIRAFTKGGFADLNQIHMWNQEFVAASKQGRRYEVIATEIERALRFMKACGVDLGADSSMHEVDFYTSHEALLLGFEEAMTRLDSLTNDYYDCSAHMLWVGDRTRALDGAHVEFLSGIHNPIACKIGPTATPQDVVALAERLDPDDEPGRLTFIARMGAGRVEQALPPLLQALKAERRTVTWICDPMHGNTFVSPSGYKTRRFDDVLAEIKAFFVVHQQEGTAPGGVHLELTADEVTECIDSEVTNESLRHHYEALCDPRLNARQSLELAFQVGELLQTR